MRSARGDRHPPEPLEKHRGRATHLGLSEAGAEPTGFLLPHHMPELDPGTQRWTCCLPVHPQELSPTQASPSLIWVLVPTFPLASQLLVFLLQAILHMPQYCPCLSPAHGPPMAPQHPWEKSQGPQPDIQAPACSAPHWPLQLHTSLLPKNQIPLPSLKDPHYDAPGPLHKLLFLPGMASSSWQPGMFLLIVQDFKHHFFIVSASFPPTPPSPQPWPQLSTHCPLDSAFSLQSLYSCQAPT